MNTLEFDFEQNVWETLLLGKTSGDIVNAMELLTVLENGDEFDAEDAFSLIDERNLVLDLDDLPKLGNLGEAALRLRREEELVKDGLSADSLEETDPLKVYLDELALMPSIGDELLLASRCADGDETAMEQLTNLGLSRVVELAKEYVGRGVLLLDLIQEGSLGLWQAVQSYCVGDYSAFRDQKIRNAMAKAILMQCRNNGLGQKMRGALSDYRSVDERLLSELGRNPTLEEIAVELHMSVEETQSIKKMLDDAYLLQQSQNRVQPEDEAPEEEQAVEDTAYFQMRQRIEDLLSILPKEDAQILTLRFGLEKGLPLSAEQTGKRLGMTAAEVTKREIAALAKLRT